MLKPMTTLITRQFTIIGRCLELSAAMLDLYLWWLPAPVDAAPLSRSRSLVPLNLPAAQ